MNEVLITAAEVGAMMLALVLLKDHVKISVRKLLHILSGPIFYISLKDCQFDIKVATAAAMVPISGSLLFLVSKIFKLSSILSIVQRSDKIELLGVIEYGFLWGLWPFSRIVHLDHIVLPALLNVTLGDGFSGCAAYFQNTKQGSQKTNLGTALYLVGSISSLLMAGFYLPFSITVSIVGCIVERIFNSNDNVWIFIACTLTGFAWNFFAKTLAW